MSTVRLEAGERTVDATCQYCAKVFQVIPSRAKHGRAKSCSPACQYAAARARPGRQVSLTCAGCGGAFGLYPSRLEQHKGAGRYCSRPCRDAHRIREHHPQFIGRPVHHRGPNWHAQKRKARKRDDYTCQHCRAPGCDVHHIRPFRLFADYKIANDLGNLITLCRPCHRRADAAFQAAEVGHVAR